MKKTITIAIAMLLALTANAQLGVTVGAGSRYLADEDEPLTDLNFGVALKLPLFLGFTAQAAAVFDWSAGVDTDEKELVFHKEKNTLYVPLQLQWGIKLGPVRPFVFGEYSFNATVNDVIEFYDQTGLGAGIDLGKLQLQAKYVTSWNDEDNPPFLARYTKIWEQQDENRLLVGLTIFF